MKVLIAAALTALICAGTGFATTTARDPRVPALQRQVASLTQQVNSLRNVVNGNATVLNQAIDLSTCRFVYQSHFNYAVLNVFNALLGNPQSADPTPSDNGACARVGITPPRRTLAAHLSPFSTMVGLLSSVAR
jgi:hypothetical protein